MTVSNVSIQNQVLGALRNHANGVTAAAVAQATGLAADQVRMVLEGLYVSSQVECRRLGESVYRIFHRRTN